MKLICTKCKQKKDENEFYAAKENVNRNGRRSYCKECGRKSLNEWSKKNRPKLSVKYKKWYDKNKDHVSEYAKEYRDKNAKKIKEKESEWRKNNKDLLKSRHKKWRDKNKSHIRTKRRKWERKIVKELSDSYVKQKVYRATNIPFKEIPKSLIEVKRLQIQIIRYLKSN